MMRDAARRYLRLVLGRGAHAVHRRPRTCFASALMYRAESLPLLWLQFHHELLKGWPMTGRWECPRTRGPCPALPDPTAALSSSATQSVWRAFVLRTPPAIASRTADPWSTHSRPAVPTCAPSPCSPAA